MNVRQVFNRVYNGQKNFMTPTVMEYGVTGPYLYELARGEFLDTELYGVTVLSRDGEKMHDLSQGFNSLDEAKAYIASLGK